ncbi:cold-shock protein, partial [Sphingomonas sp. 28-62-20]|uniref:cold-shock protein n=1 Tax=Sphingomonas sp. 28-62-20 TaxID=1970433 RepID=UPI0035A83744
LSVQQDEAVTLGRAWDYYFPFEASSHSSSEELSSFITVLRYTFHRPRDVLSVLDTLESLYLKTGDVVNYFTDKHLTSSEFRRAYGEYMLGEIKDSLSFYYDESEYQLFLKFFEYLDGAHKFDFSKFIGAYADFMKFVATREVKIPDFMGSAEELLQFLYDQNVLSYIEGTSDKPFIRWCFIERSTSNISPKVKTHSNYEIHYSLASALNTGKKIQPRRKTATAVVAPTKAGFFEGNIKFYQSKQNYGFIVQDGMPLDMFFHGSRALGNANLSKGSRVRFRLEKDENGRLMAVDIMNVKGD